MKFIFILVILSFFGCAKRVNSSSVIAYKKDVYEKISDVKIPGKSIVLQTYDNDDFFTFTTLKVDSLTLVNFVRSKKFKRRIDTEFPPLFFGAEELKDNKPDAKYCDYSYYGRN
jgi:hypothetical protein